MDAISLIHEPEAHPAFIRHNFHFTDLSRSHLLAPAHPKYQNNYQLPYACAHMCKCAHAGEVTLTWPVPPMAFHAGRAICKSAAMYLF